jgi:hypothetical protein
MGYCGRDEGAASEGRDEGCGEGRSEGAARPSRGKGMDRWGGGRPARQSAHLAAHAQSVQRLREDEESQVSARLRHERRHHEQQAAGEHDGRDDAAVGGRAGGRAGARARHGAAAAAPRRLAGRRRRADGS